VEDVTPVVVLRRALREGLVPIAICELLARANISSLVKVGMTCLGSAIVAIVVIFVVLLVITSDGGSCGDVGRKFFVMISNVGMTPKLIP
jgi:hypothetical protein